MENFFFYPTINEKMLEEARSIFPNTDLAAEGMVFDVTSRVVP